MPSRGRSHCVSVPYVLARPLYVGGGCVCARCAQIISPFQYLNELGFLSPFMLQSIPEPYGWGPTATTNPWSAPSDTSSDRMVAIVSWARVGQGVYVCANGGNCTAPNVCKCADGWIGFDCRTPVCTQGYYEPSLRSVYAGQGLYDCSHRAMTQWENDATAAGKFLGYMHDHPNYVSHFQNPAVGWTPTYRRAPGLGNETNEGWRRNGWWELLGGAAWVKGQCTPLYNRTCQPSFVSFPSPGARRYVGVQPTAGFWK